MSEIEPKIRYKNYQGFWKIVSVKDFIQNKIDGTGYDRGELEAIQASIDNTGAIVSNLVSFLKKNKIIDDIEIMKLVKGIY